MNSRQVVRFPGVVSALFFCLAGLADARPVTAVWDANTDPYTVGYRLYAGTAPGVYQLNVDVGNVTSYQLDVPDLSLYFVVRAYNAAGQLSLPSNEVFLTFGGANRPPTLVNPGDLVVPAGPVTAQLPAFDPEGAPLTFSATGLPQGVSLNASTGVVSGVLTAGTYNLTVTVSDGQLSSQVSFRVTVLGGACPGAPSAATLAPAVVSGTQVSVSWTQPTGGIAPDSYVVEAGSAPGQSNIAVVPIPVALRTFQASGPNGQYYLRVRGRNACGETASNEITFRIGAPPPGAPRLSYQRSGSTVSLSWTAPTSGTPTSYLIEVGSASGLANLLSHNTGSTARTLSATAPAGRYYVRVRAVNGSGAGSASNEVVISVP